MSETKCTKERFLKDVAEHQLKIVLDAGMHRHIELRNPKDASHYFNVTTWPGYLCISGDMGEYVFHRVDDMFAFFRSKNLEINPGYWHEKLMAEDCTSGSKKYDEDIFCEEVKKHFNEWCERQDEEEVKECFSDIWQNIEDEVLSCKEFECEARHAAADFKSSAGFNFDDFWECTLTDFTFRFIWCLYAICWGIQQYDKAPADGLDGSEGSDGAIKELLEEAREFCRIVSVDLEAFYEQRENPNDGDVARRALNARTAKIGQICKIHSLIKNVEKQVFPLRMISTTEGTEK